MEIVQKSGTVVGEEEKGVYHDQAEGESSSLAWIHTLHFSKDHAETTSSISHSLVQHT